MPSPMRRSCESRGSGHSLMAERPDDVLRALQDFAGARIHASGGLTAGGHCALLHAVNWDTYWLYVLTEIALSLSPGPAVMLVIACGLTHGARRSTCASLGILSANAIYFAMSATALGAVLVASREFFIAVKWIGAAYLVYVGLSALFGRSSPITVSNSGARSRLRAISISPA